MTNLTDGPLVLGIETSCDETGAGIVRGRELLADEVASSMDQHARFGGVVPEVASRAHLEAMVPVIEGAFAKAGVRPADIDAVAVTAGPGLAGALMVGVAAAKAYAYALGKPLYGVNHLAAHVAVDQLEHGPLPAPCLALLVSGGHSSLLLVPDITGEVRSLGATIDDAAGEAYDKVARVLGMPFPGGPPIDRAAASGDPAAIRFPRAKLHDGSYDFSFAGLKTAVARWVEARRDAGEPVPVADVAASFQEAVADVLTRKAVAACREYGVTDLVIGGGVAANSRLRALAAERCASAGIQFRAPRPGLCTDNGAMVAALGRGGRRGRPPAVHPGPPGRLVPPGDRGPGPLAPGWARPAGRRQDFLRRRRRKTTAMAAPTAATGMRRFRIGTTTNLNAFSDSSCLTTGAAGLAAAGAVCAEPAGLRRPPAVGRAPRRLAGPGVVGLRGGGRRAGGAVGVDHGLKVGGELLDELAAHLGQQGAAELGGLAGHVQRRVNGDQRLARAVAGRQVRLHGRRRGARAAGLLAGRLDRDGVAGLVLVGELGGALVGQRERAELDLDLALDLVALDRGDAGAGHARGDPLNVKQHIPGLLGRDGDGERVIELNGHASLLSRRFCL